MTYREQEILTSDGRVLEVATVGDPHNSTVFLHHGSPGSSRTLEFFSKWAHERSLYFVTMSRAGYGLSSRHEGRSVGDVVPDVHAVLEFLGRGTYLSVGWSGGGPHALACAALDSARCAGAWALAGVAPSTDFDWTEGMGPDELAGYEISRTGGEEYERYVAGLAEGVTQVTKQNIVEILRSMLSERDVAVFDAEFQEMLARDLVHAFDRGYYGYLDDDQAFLKPWGFEPTLISVPVEVWFGDQDRMVPSRHGAWLREHIPHAHGVHHPEDGHFSIVMSHQDQLFNSFDRILGRK